MSDTKLNWYVINTHAKQETRVEKNLTAWKVEVFNPRLRERRWNAQVGNFRFKSKPLFPQYVFARFDRDSMLAKVRFTRGVHSLVGFGNGPTPVAAEIIDLIRMRLDSRGFVRMNDEFAPGDRVRIEAGPLASLCGVFEREIDGDGRAKILLTTINYQAHVVVHKELLQRIPA